MSVTDINMGVLGLFSYLLKNYKNAFNTSSIPPIDAIYLDGNALLYPIAEISKDPNVIAEQLLSVASDYANKYKCQCHIYMDGAAHMGKIRQQRMRRFLYEPTSIDTPSTTVGNRDGSISVNDGTLWSPAMFSPGTDMMLSIHNYIQNHIHLYPSIGIYSSYMEHGEGEHKIIKHIRSISNVDTYRVAIVGKDADLLLMSMGTSPKEGYNAYIYVIRHNDRYDGDPDGYRPTDPIYIVDTPLLREMILKGSTHRSIWNFIIGTFLIGNDFLPPIPEMSDINIALPIILSSKYILYKDRSIYWKGLIEFIKSISIKDRDLKDIYGRWIQNANSTLSIDTFSNIYYFHMSRFTPSIDRIVFSWLTTVYWIFLYYHNGMDSASISWQYPLSYSPSLSSLRSISIENIEIDTLYRLCTEKVKPLTPIQALCAILPIWLHNLIPIDHRNKIDTIRQYYPYRFNIVDATGDPIIPSIPYDVLSSL